MGYSIAKSMKCWYDGLLELRKGVVIILANKIIIKKGSMLHDRFILTLGEGWVVGHSLKDFGKKPVKLQNWQHPWRPKRLSIIIGISPKWFTNKCSIKNNSPAL